MFLRGDVVATETQLLFKKKEIENVETVLLEEMGHNKSFILNLI
jgi:hypothetical protein